MLATPSVRDLERIARAALTFTGLLSLEISALLDATPAAWNGEFDSACDGVVASLKRWGQLDGLGQQLAAHTASLEAVDASQTATPRIQGTARSITRPARLSVGPSIGITRPCSTAPSVRGADGEHPRRSALPHRRKS